MFRRPSKRPRHELQAETGWTLAPQTAQAPSHGHGQGLHAQQPQSPQVPQQQQQQQHQRTQIQRSSVVRPAFFTPPILGRYDYAHRFYTAIAAVDVARVVPIDLVHLLVKAAMTDASIAQDLEWLSHAHQHAQRFSHDPSSPASLPMMWPREEKCCGRTAPNGRQQSPPPPPLPPPHSSCNPSPTSVHAARPRPFPSAPHPIASNYQYVLSSLKRPAPMSPVDLEFNNLMERAERELGYTGVKMVDLCETGEHDSSHDVCHRVGKLMDVIVFAVQDAFSWRTKVNAISALRHILFVIITLPGAVGEHIRTRGGGHDKRFHAAVARLNVRERVALRDEDDGGWMEDFVELELLARRRGIMAEVHKVRELLDQAKFGGEARQDDAQKAARVAMTAMTAMTTMTATAASTTTDKAKDDTVKDKTVKCYEKEYGRDSGGNVQSESAVSVRPLSDRPQVSRHTRVPWYPLTPNKLIVPENAAMPPLPPNLPSLPDEDHSSMAAKTLAAVSSLGEGSMLPNDEVRAKAQCLRGNVARWALLVAASVRRQASWATKLTSLNTLSDMCSHMLRSRSRAMEVVREGPTAVDQYFWRAVQRLTVQERKKLGKNREFMNRLEELVQMAREVRWMMKVEAVAAYIRDAMASETGDEMTMGA